MAEANVTSVEAIEAFRNSLIIFLEKARAALHDVSDQVGRTRTWVQFEQSSHWQNERRRRARALEQAEAELFSAKLSQWTDSAAQLKITANRCRAALSEAEDRLRAVKRWGRDYDQTVTVLAQKVEGLAHIVNHEMPKALAYLDNTAGNLHLYSESFGVSKGAAAPPTPDSEEGSDSEQEITESPSPS